MKKQQIYAIVSDAEQLANASGLEKFRQVLNQAYTALSPIFKFFISEDDIKRGIEYSLNKLEAYAQLQANTSTETKSDAATNNTNIPTGSDLAAKTAQDSSTTPINTETPTPTDTTVNTGVTG
jgi:hypothetical protein